MPSPTARLLSLALLVLLGGRPALAQQGPAPSSPLDHLDPARIPAEEWVPDLPDDVVAVIGSRRGRHDWPVTCVAYSPDGKWVASGGADHVIRLWDAATLEAVGVLDDCEGVEALAFSPDGKRLAAAGYTTLGPFTDQATAWLGLWDVGPAGITPGGRLRWESTRLLALAFAPDGKTVAVGMQKAGLLPRFPDEGPGNWAQLVDVSGDTPEPKDTLAAGGEVRSVAWSPDGRTLAAGGSSINLWGLGAEPGAGESRVVRPGLNASAGLAAGLGVLGALALVGRFYVRRRCRQYRGFRWFDSATGTWHQSDGTHWEGYRRFRVALGWTAAGLGSLLALCLLVVGIAWLARSGPEGPRGRVLPVLAGEWRAVAFSPDGRRLGAAGSDGKLWLWDVSGPEPREEARLEGHTKTVRALAFSPDGRTLASAGEDGTLRLWDLQGPPRSRAVARGDVVEVWPLAFSPDGRSLVAGGGWTLRRWDVGDTLREKDDGGGRLTARSMAFAADGRTLLLGCYDRSLRLWNLGGDAPRERRSLKGLADIPWRLALSPDGRALAVSHNDNTIRLWDLGGDGPRERAVLRGPEDLEGRKEPIPILPRLEVPRAQFSPDGKFLLGGTPPLRPARSSPEGEAAPGGRREWRLWDVKGATPRERALPRPRVRDTAAAFSPDGRTLAVEDADGDRTRLWDLGNGRPREVGSLRKWGLSPAFSPDGRRLLAVHCDKGGIAVREWDLGRRRLIRETALEGEVPAVVAGLVNDGRTVAAVTDVKARRLVVWSGGTGKRVGEYHLPGRALLLFEPLALAPDGRHLAVLNIDGTVYILRIGAHGRWGPEDHYRRGLLHAGRQDYERAITAFSEAIRLDPWHARAHYQRGLAHAARGDYAKAKKDLDTAFGLDPTLAPPSKRGK